MVRSHLRFAALVSLLAALGWPAIVEAKSTWTRAETKHFVFYSTGRPSELETFAIETEKFDAMLRARFSVEEDEIVNRLTIYVLPTSKDVSKLKGKDNFLAGFYQASTEGSYAVSNREKPQGKYDLSGQQVLFHEYAHHFFARHLTAAYPVWLSEGFAEYYSTTTFQKDGIYTVGTPLYSRAYGLIAGPKMPIRNVLFGTIEGLDARQGDIFYGRSWLLTHKLMSSQEGLDALAKYIGDLNRGDDPQTAATNSFGDLDALDKELERIEKRPLTAFKATLPVTFDAGYKAVQLDEVESELVELQLQRRAADDKVKVRDALRTMAAAHPDRADVANELAQAEYDVAQRAEDEAAERAALAETDAAADRALALEPNHVRANVLKARVLLDLKDVDVADEDYSAARKFLVRANRADPLDPLPLFLYFRTYAEQGKQAPAVAFEGLVESFYRAKEVTDFRVTLAYALANQGRFNEALPMVRYLANDPHGGAQGKALMDELLRLKQMRADYEARVAAFQAERNVNDESELEAED